MTLDAGEAALRDVTAGFDRAVAIARRATSPSDLDPMWDMLYEAAHLAPTAVHLALSQLASDDAHIRTTACRLAGVVAEVHRESRQPVADALIRLDIRRADHAMVAAFVRAAGSTTDPRTLPLLLAHVDRDDPRVRQAVATSLAAVMWDEPRPDGIAALLRLSADHDPEVRNWATFGFGWQLPVDGADVRAALWARTVDDYPDAREEGIRGLARRHDPRAVPLVAELLATGDVHVHTFDAAAMLGTDALLPALSTFDPIDRGVIGALIACNPIARAARDDAAWALFTTVATRYPELPVALYCERFEPGIWLDIAPVGATTQMAGWPVADLLEQADHDVEAAIDLVVAQLLAAADS